MVLKPQITKEYVNSQVIGRPDFSLLHDNYEKGDKFYEPQYSVIQGRRGHHQTSDTPSQCVDEQLEKADVQFRETESQIIHQKAVQEKI